MPMPESKNWFIKNMHQFDEQKTSTHIGNNKYTRLEDWFRGLI